MTKIKGTLEKNGKELTALRTYIEEAVGHPIKKSADFSELSGMIQDKIREYVSVNTLKRIWNYIDDGNVPSYTTLSVLSRFLGFADWDAFLTNLDQTATSQEFVTDGIRSDSLTEGDLLTITWQPNRKIVIMYVGDNTFMVKESYNSKLTVNDTFKCLYFFDNQPLFIDELMHVGFDKPVSYICGKKGGVRVAVLPPPPPFTSNVRNKLF